MNLDLRSIRRLVLPLLAVLVVSVGFAACGDSGTSTDDKNAYIKQVNDAGVAMLVVEQNANVSLSIADRGYVLSTGRVVLEGPAGDLLQNEELRKAYLGR